MVVEGGRVKKLYGAEAEAIAMFLFWPLDGTTAGTGLFEHPVRRWEFWKAYALLHLRPQRSASAIGTVAEGLSPWIVYEGGELKSPQPVRWVLGTSPFVLAVGTEWVPTGKYVETPTWLPEHKLGTFYAMVGEADLGQTASEVIVLDDWPADLKDRGTDWEKAFAAELAKRARRVVLDRPMTLREILEKRVWARAREVGALGAGVQ
jgi:hypothetical protein